MLRSMPTNAAAQAAAAAGASASSAAASVAAAASVCSVWFLPCTRTCDLSSKGPMSELKLCQGGVILVHALCSTAPLSHQCAASECTNHPLAGKAASSVKATSVKTWILGILAGTAGLLVLLIGGLALRSSRRRAHQCVTSFEPIDSCRSDQFGERAVRSPTTPTNMLCIAACTACLWKICTRWCRGGAAAAAACAAHDCCLHAARKTRDWVYSKP